MLDTGCLPAVPAMFARSRSRCLLATLTIFTGFAGDVCTSHVTGLCCHCEEQRDEAISCEGFPMFGGVQGLFYYPFICSQVGRPPREIAAPPTTRLAMTAPVVALRSTSFHSALRTPHSAFASSHPWQKKGADRNPPLHVKMINPL